MINRIYFRLLLGAFLFLSATFLTTDAFSQLIKDTIYMNNGTKVIGKIKSIKVGIITFDPDDANDITVQIRKLRTIGGGSRVFRVETTQLQKYFGKIIAHPESNYLTLISDTSAIADLYIQDISVLYPYEQSVLQRFSGNFGLGYSYTKSSGLGRLNFDAYVKYVSKKDEIILSGSGIYSVYDSAFSRDRELVSLKYNYYFSGNWFFTGFVAYQRNLELGLQRRYQEGLGIGNKFLTTRHVYAWGRAGVVFNREKSTEEVTTNTLTELFGQLEVNVFRFQKPKINVLLTESFYYSLSQAGRFRNDGALKITWEIFKDFNLNLEPYNNYDSKPPVPENPTSDYGIVFGISYLFH